MFLLCKIQHATESYRDVYVLPHNQYSLYLFECIYVKVHM